MQEESNAQEPKIELDQEWEGAIQPSCCGGRKKKEARDERERRDLISRLNRMEGQIRGIRNMLLEERYCVDILTQVSSVSSALKAFSKELLQSHIESCVVSDIQEGKTEAVEELCSLIKKIM